MIAFSFSLTGLIALCLQAFFVLKCKPCVWQQIKGVHVNQIISTRQYLICWLLLQGIYEKNKNKRFELTDV